MLGMGQQFRVCILFCINCTVLEILFKIKSKEVSSVALVRLRLGGDKSNMGEELATSEDHLYVGLSITCEGRNTLVHNVLVSPILIPFAVLLDT